MFFLMGFAWLVAASFAFVIAILSPNWLTFTMTDSTGAVTTVQRGIFVICSLIPTNDTSTATKCISMIQQGFSADLDGKWIYQFAIACASLAIACAALSIITVWLSGIYFQVRKRTKRTAFFLLCISLLLLLVVCTSFVVWILVISEPIRLGVLINRHIFNWPMWLAVGATGGYMLSFLTMLFSFCAICRRQHKMEQNYYRPRNQF